MMPIFRLDSVSPALAESFRKASPIKCRRAALVACELAASSAGLTGQEIISALETLRSGTPAMAVVREQLEKLAARFDDEYLRLWDEADEEGDESKKSEALQLFSKNCAVSALVFALTDEPGQLHEAIYEAIVALEDPGDLVRAVENELR
ncbi:hypothetical protein WME75_39615 [Sorangium sp. So ce1014]|uniref:hypothetical protein n=1 Tax=Sorangium sp. So ce1014 TaxID=3133326 RepID=UPI003F5E3F81